MIALLLVAPVSLSAQDDDTPGPTNTVFFEAFGQAIFWSANFEHTEYGSERLAFHMRAGFGLWSTRTVSSCFTLPLTFSLSYGDIHRAEAGAGFLFYNYGYSGPTTERTTGTLFPTLHAGYRLQKEYGGLFLRAGIMVAEVGDAPGFSAAPGTWGFNPYIGVGSTF